MSSLLDPKILMSIKDLSLVAKKTIDGFMTGNNKSSVKGTGLEFSQYRSYQPGDDLRWLDWKMYARSDRYYIRESEIETSISVSFLIDASNSMNHRDKNVAKIDYAKYLAASLGYLAHLHGDAIGLYVFQDGEIFSLSSKRDSQHMARFYYQLENISPKGKFINPVQYRHLFTANPKKELLVFISDFYEHNGEIMQLLNTLSSLRHEIIAFHLMSANEMQMDYEGYDEVEDLETGKNVHINSKLQSEIYKQNLQQYLQSLRMQLLDKNIFYRLMTTDKPLEEALRDFLKQRAKTII
ncbi:MAG TPA: DUF58 domain-containing protein [Puia sp.]|nr:DUF58 domain-containing protein [Puia sp.]